MSQHRDLRDQLAPAYDEAEIADAWRGIASKRARRRRRWSPFVVPAFGLAAAAAIAFVVLRPAGLPPPARVGALRTTAPISIEAGATLDPDRAASIPMALDDGSRVQIAPRSRVQVLANDGERFSMFLERGTLDVTVQPGGPRRWEIETPLATVEVVGSVFRVAQSEHRVVVAVERGVVMVRGERVKGRVQRLTDGQQLVVEDHPITAVREPVDAPTPLPGPVASPSTPAPAAIEPDAPARAKPVVPPPARPTAPTISAAIFEADQLRPTDAIGAAARLEAALAATPDDPSAGLARFALGRLYLESLGTPGKAVPLFRAIIARGSPHSLLEDARARLVEALVKSGDVPAATAAFGEYERLYPQGRRLPALRAML